MVGVTNGDAVFSVAVIGGRLVATGEHLDQGALWATDDGIHWTLVPGFPSEPVGTDAHAQLVRVSEGPSGFVAIGGVYAIDWGTPRLWFSADGNRWDDVFGPADPFKGIAGGIDAVAGWDQGYVAAGGVCSDYATCTPQVWLSPDGKTWRTAVKAAFPGVSNGLGHLAAGNGSVVAIGFVGAAGSVFASKDGEIWNAAPQQPALAGASLTGIAFGEGTFIATGETASADGSRAPGIWSSPNGLAWTQVFHGSTGLEIREIAASGSGFVAIGDDLPSNPAYDPSQGSALDYTMQVWTSTDGSSWHGPIVGYSGGWTSFGMAFIGNEVFVPGAIGHQGDPDFESVMFRGEVPRS
jgi:hypothetical protein